MPIIPATEAANRSCKVLFQKSEYSDLMNNAIETAISQGGTKAGMFFMPHLPGTLVKGCALTMAEAGYSVQISAVLGHGTQVDVTWDEVNPIQEVMA